MLLHKLELCMISIVILYFVTKAEIVHSFVEIVKNQKERIYFHARIAISFENLPQLITTAFILNET